MKIACSYYYRGSSNGYLHMKQVASDEIQLSSDYGEVIKDVYTVTDLIKVISDLESGNYA